MTSRKSTAVGHRVRSETEKVLNTLLLPGVLLVVFWEETGKAPEGLSIVTHSFLNTGLNACN